MNAPLPEEFTIDLLAESFGCLPSQVREEDELDLELRLMRIRARQQIAAELA